MRSGIRRCAAMGAALALAGCSSGGGAGAGDGDGDGDAGAFNFNEANMMYAAGVGARAVDGFAPSDLLDAAFVALARPGALASGAPEPLLACAAGSAALTWTDVDRDGAWSLDVTTVDDAGTSRVTGSFRFTRTAAGAHVTERGEALPGPRSPSPRRRAAP